MDEIKTTLKSKIMAWLGAQKTEPTEKVENVELELSQATLKDGTAISYDKLEIGGHLLIKNQSDTAVPAPAGEYELMDGTIVTIGEDNLITGLVPGNMAEPEGVDPVEPIEPEEVVEPAEISKEVTDLMDRVAVLEEVISKLIESQEAMKSELSLQNDELKKQVIELSATPISIPVVLTETNLEKTLFEKRVDFLNKQTKK